MIAEQSVEDTAPRRRPSDHSASDSSPDDPSGTVGEAVGASLHFLEIARGTRPKAEAAGEPAAST